MKIAVCIIDHDQDASVARTIKKLDRQTKKPDEIIVCCDSGIPFMSDRPDVLPQPEQRGQVVPGFRL